MKLKWLGHSCFKLTGSGVSVVTDPYKGVGYKMPKVSADVVTISHFHDDHDNAAAVGGDPVVLSKEGVYSVGGATIIATKSYHDAFYGARRGENTIFTFELDGLRACHMGDIGQPLSQFDVSALGKVDVLFIPIGGHYTIDAREAMRYIEKISPKVAVAMHYAAKGCTIDIADEKEFVKIAGSVKYFDSEITVGEEPSVLVPTF